MLLGDDVIEGEGEYGDIGRDPAILTTVLGPLPDSTIQRLVHGLRFLAGFLQGEEGLGPQDGEDLIRLDVRFELVPLRGGDPPLLLFLEELEHSLLVLLPDAQPEDEPRPLGRDVPAIDFEGTAQDGGAGILLGFEAGLHGFAPEQSYLVHLITALETREWRLATAVLFPGATIAAEPNRSISTVRGSG